MKPMKKIILLSFTIIVSAILANDVSAQTIYLPESSYAQQEGAWQGFSLYDEQGWDVRIDFAVYDRQLLEEGTNEYKMVSDLDCGRAISCKEEVSGSSPATPIRLARAWLERGRMS